MSDGRSADRGDGRIRVVHCIGSMAVGGAEQKLTDVVRLLPAERYDQTVALFRRQGELLDRLDEAGCEVVELGRGTSERRVRGRATVGLAARYARLAAVLRRIRPHIVHGQLDGANVAVWAAGRAARTPIVLTSQLNQRAAGTNRQRLADRAHRAASGVYVNSEALRSEVVDEAGVLDDRVRLIRNGVDTTRFRPVDGDRRAAARRRAGHTDTTRVLVCVANLHPYKGHADLIRAVALLDRPDARLVLVGRDAGAAPECRKLVDQLGLGDAVRFTGHLDDVAGAHATADVFVHPSHEEGSSNSVLEAMASGLAVVATDVGGTGETVTDGITGFLVPASDPAAMANAIAGLLDDPAQAATMGAAAAASARGRFGVEAMVDGFDRWYRDLVGDDR